MTVNNSIGANAEPEEPDGIEWDRLETEVREQSGWLTRVDRDAGPVDPDADAYLWPSVTDPKGKPTGELARPNPEAARVALERAAAVSSVDVDVLADAISESEAREIIAQASQQRSTERELDGQVAELRAELASKGAKRQAEHEAHLAETRRRRENRAAAALERRTRALDPTSRIVRLAAAERWVPWIAVLPAALAAVLGAVNVGVSLDVLSPGTQVINWLVEPLLTLPIVAILIAQILGAVGAGKANPYRGLEWSLVTVALVLNVGLHLAVDGLAPAAFVWAIVPAGLAISAHLVPRLIRQVRDALAAESGPSTAPAGGYGVTAQAGPDRSGSTWTAPGPSQVGAGEAPESRSEDEVLSELAEAVRDGRTDPGTGRPIDPSSAESIRRTVRVSKGRARALRDRLASTEAR
ncbi:hypothetical protein [Glycomyces xiaoerkulensis]|uniref:hypothetical protein n=1 Tax=Glycomyces xiaoerkulensis TaxID=2038139 RepID=UPI000C25A58B|nr:hypothetical protein [Glycomyces xiaoerkulensis]